MKRGLLLSILGVMMVASTAMAQTVYLFINIADDTGSDKAIQADLENEFGATVEIYDDTDAPGFERPFDLEAADMAFFSESVLSGNIAELLYHELDATPMICGEQALHDDFSFKGSGNGNRPDSVMEIVDNEHPITQGFDLGLVEITNGEHDMARLEDPPEWVRVLAVDPETPNHARLWVIEKDTETAIGPSPDIRIGSWLQGNDSYENITDDGRRLAFQMFAYALGVDPPAGSEPPAAVENWEIH